MLWSLFKILLFVAIVALMAWAALEVMAADTGITIQFGGIPQLGIVPVELNLGPLQSVLAAIALFGVIWVGFKLLGLLFAFLKFLLGDETALSRRFDKNRERRGHEALNDSLLALASGEGRLAISKATKAEKLLGNPQVTRLITAEAAELVGERKTAEESYKLLLKDDKTRFVGIRGLMKQKLSEGDTDTALLLAEKAYALKPRHQEMQDTLLQLQAEHHDWSGARKTLGTKLKTGTMPRDLHRRRDAVLAVSEAVDILDEGKSIEAREAAIEANKKSPDLIPASVMAARGYIEKGKPKNAARVVKKTWEVSPHPELAAAFAEIVPDEDASARLKRFSNLTKINQDHPETRMLLAELNIAAEDFPEARRSLGDLPTVNPTARSLSIMAAVERGEGADDAVVRGWLAKAVTAPRGPQWICENCNHIEPTWVPVCSNCSGFDTLLWKDVPQSEIAMPTGTDMLPLIVGKPADAAVEPIGEKVVESTVEPEQPPEQPEIVDAPATFTETGEILETDSGSVKDDK